AAGAAASRDRADHARRSRAELIRSARAAGRRFLVVPPVSFVALLGITIAAVTVLSIHKRLRPSVLTDCHKEPVNSTLNALHLGLYPIGLLNSASPYNLPRIFEARIATTE